MTQTNKGPETCKVVNPCNNQMVSWSLLATKKVETLKLNSLWVKRKGTDNAKPQL